MKTTATKTISSLDIHIQEQLERDLETIGQHSRWLQEIVCQPNSNLKVDLEISETLARLEIIRDMAGWQIKALTD